jgi:hypothetical protein
MASFLTPIFTAVAGLVGVALGGAIALYGKKRQRADEHIQRQLSEFYAPLHGIRRRILAKSELRVKSSGAHGAAWAELLAGPRATGDPELLKKTVEEKWPAFEEAQKYSEREWVQDIVPLYRKMVDLFTEKMWLAEPSTRQHFQTLVEFVEIWNRYLGGGIAPEALATLGHDENKVKPLYEDVAEHVESLTRKIQNDAANRYSKVKRGLNRLCLVFAAAWMVCGFLYAYTSGREAKTAACESLKGEEGVTRLSDGGSSPESAGGVFVQGPDGQRYLFPAGTTKADAISYFNRQREAQRACNTTTPVRTALVVACVPAVLGFALFQIALLTVVWVWKGFS